MPVAKLNSSLNWGNAHWLWLACAILGLDRYTKYLAVNFLEPQAPQALSSFFNLYLAHNTGAAFSFLGQAGGWQRWALAATAITIVLGLIIWLLRLPKQSHVMAVAISLIIGGAIGNCWDRVHLGYVVDFFDFHLNTWHFATFNIADCGICVGATLLAICTLFNHQE